MNIPVDLATDSSPSDTITVTLTDSNGVTVSGEASGGGASVEREGPKRRPLADGTIRVSATATDSLGNTSKPVTGPSIWKDVVAPAQPTLSMDRSDITGDEPHRLPGHRSDRSCGQGGATVTRPDHGRR